MSTNLRQGDASVYVEGILATKELEVKDTASGKAVVGNVSIKVDDTNTIRFGVYITEKKKDGTDNPVWESIQTVMNEYRSIAEVGEELADKISTKGQFNTYKNQNGMDVTNYKASFFHRITEREMIPAKNFEADCFIKSKTWEVDSEGNETGRLKIKAIAHDYNIIILDIVAPKSNEYNPDFANVVDGALEIGATYKLNGYLVNSRVEKKATALFGTVRGEIEYKNELVLTGSIPPYEDDRAFDAEAIRLALQEYEDSQSKKAQERQNKGVVNTTSKPSGAAFGRTLGF